MKANTLIKDRKTVPKAFHILMPALAILLLSSMIFQAGVVNAQPANDLLPSDGAVLAGVGTRAGEFTQYVSDVGKYPAIQTTYYSWGVAFPNDLSNPISVTSILANGTIPLVTWEPYSVSLQAIANGSQDQYIDSWAYAAKAVKKPFFLRFAHEMNGNWYPWAQDPTTYKLAWQRIYDRFQAAGATNVAFVWCPNWESRGPSLNQYYPGDGYVDWVGVDLYNWPRWPRTFDYMVQGVYSEFSIKKPILIPEMASAENFTPDPGYENPAAQNKSRWITDMFNSLNTKYPDIKGISWFNLNKETDWRVESSPSALAAYKAGLSNPRYQGRDDIGYIWNRTGPTPPPDGYGVNASRMWAAYNGTSKPIEQFVIKPGTTVQQNITYKNTGNRTDSYTVSIDGLPSAWYTVAIDGNKTVNSGDSRYGWVNITPQYDGNFTFTVRVASDGNPSVNSSVSYMLVAANQSTPIPPGTYNLTVTNDIGYYNGSGGPAENFNVQPNGTFIDGISFKNTGLKPDSYSFNITGIPSSWYSVNLNDSSPVDPGSSRLYNVTIVPRQSGIFSVGLKIWSNSQPSVSVTENFTLYVVFRSSPPGPYNVQMLYSLANYTGTTKPIESYNVTINTTVEQGISFRNLGSMPDTYNVSIWGLPQDWYNISMNGPATVAPNDQRSGTAFIKPKAAGIYHFTVRVISSGNPQLFDYQEYTLYAVNASPGTYGVSTTSRWAVYNGTNRPIQEFNITPGTTVQQGVYLKNTGTLNDTYAVSVSGLPTAWYNITMYGPAALLPGGDRYGNVFITPVAAGDYTFTVKVTSNGNPSLSGSQNYTMHVINPIPPGYAVNTTRQKASYRGSTKYIEQFAIGTGRTVTQNIYIKNTGVKSDSYTVSIIGLPASWYTININTANSLKPGSSRSGNARITPRAAGDYTFTVKVVSKTDPRIYDSQTYTMHVK